MLTTAPNMLRGQSVMLCLAWSAVIRATMPAYMAPTTRQNLGNPFVACRFGNGSIKASVRNIGFIACSPRAHAMSVVVPTSLGCFMDHKFMHVHLCLHCTCAQLQSEGALPSLGTRLASRECWYPSQPTYWGCPVHMGRMANMS